MQNLPIFTARVIKGSGKGKAMGFPTINLDLVDVPAELPEGVYAARAIIDDVSFFAAMHYGPRPVHGLPRSCELHILVKKLGVGCWALGVGDVTVEVMKRLRDVRDFGSEEELKKQIVKDIERVKIAVGC